MNLVHFLLIIVVNPGLGGPWEGRKDDREEAELDRQFVFLVTGLVSACGDRR